MSQPNRLAADAAHRFGGIELDRSKPLSFRIDGRRVDGFAGDTVLSAVLAAGIDSSGTHNGSPIGLGDSFAPLATHRRGMPLPIARLPALDGLELASVGTRRGLGFGQPQSLRLDLASRPEPPWLRLKPDAILTADLLVIGGGIAGLSAALAAADRGQSIVLVERRPWLGGDARFFGAVGDEESPEALSERLIAELRVRPGVTILTSAEVFAFAGTTATLHQVEVADGVPRGRVVAASAPHVVLATGALQRLPVFSGNRLPGVLSAIEAYHLAKRYGVTLGRSAIVATQGNHGYRLALRLSDAGVAIVRIVDTRIDPQSRFVDFAKAGGLTLATGQVPVAVGRPRGQLQVSLAHADSSQAAAVFDTGQLILAAGWQPELTLWTLAGGSIGWSAERSALVARGQAAGIALAGSAAGLRSTRAVAESGRIAIALLAGETARPIDDTEPGTHLETPDAPTPHAPSAAAPPAYFTAGSSLVARAPDNAEAPKASARSRAAVSDSTASSPSLLSIGDVAASVELGLIAPADAGAIAEERGAPGAELVAATWTPGPAAAPAPDYLANRFGSDPQRVHLIVDQRRRFAVGALIYAAGSKPDPEQAVGVIVEASSVGGIALVAKAALKRDPRFVVEMTSGPSPARLAPTPWPARPAAVS